MASLKLAIRNKCKDCIYDPLVGGTFLAQIEACTCRRCPLWEVRPLTNETINLQRKKNGAIDALIDSLPDEDEASAVPA